MADVELEIINLATGESIGIYPLTLCFPDTFELDVGSYRFIATYLKTIEVLEADVDIAEGVNPPLDFEFTPITHMLSIATTFGGTTDPPAATYAYVEDTTVTVTAIPDEGYNFDHWIQDGVKYTSNPLNVLMDSDHSLTAYFSEEPPPPPETYNLTVSTTLGGTTDPTPNIYEYDAGVTATVSAVPENGYYFRHWELDGVERTENPINVLIDRDYLLRAVFSTAAPPPPPEINLPIIGGIAVAVVDAALILYYIATYIYPSRS